MSKLKMRVIPLKPKTGDTPTYRAILKGMFERPKNPNGPTTIKEIREVAPILDMIDAAEDGGNIHLTESQYHDCKERMENNPWAANLRSLLPFFADIENAEEIEVEVELKH